MKTAKNSGSKPRRCRNGRRLAIAAALLWAALPGALAGTPEPPLLPAIYPSGGTLPANHLKFYVHFAEPMREGVFLAHCRLLDERGEPVLEPFRETELWSDDRRRLTLWLHPGRQKTGVNLNAEFGPVLEAGRRYTLVISGQWLTERGAPLGGDLRKNFRAGPRAARQLDAREWRLEIPAAGTTQPLTVRFPGPLDHALLRRCLHVLEAAGAPVQGTVEVSEQERTWRFVPERPWKGEEHHLAAESILEDLAGNSLARPFEVDLSAPPPRPVPRLVTRSFQPLAKGR